MNSLLTSTGHSSILVLDRQRPEKNCIVLVMVISRQNALIRAEMCQ